MAAILISPGRDGHNRHWLIRAKSNTAFTSLKTLGKGDALAQMTVTDPAAATTPR